MTAIVTLKEFIEWILRQDDDHPVDMDEIRPSDPCGCLMVQYGKEKGFDFHFVTSSRWHNMGQSDLVAVMEPELSIQNIVPLKIWGSKTFKPIKNHINSEIISRFKHLFQTNSDGGDDTE